MVPSVIRFNARLLSGLTTMLRTRIRFAIGGILAVLAIPMLGLGMMSIFSKRPETLGLVEGRLQACPDSPNCVSSKATKPEQAMAPISFVGGAEDAIKTLRQVIQQQPRATIVTQEGHYLHAEFTSLIFRFVDDVEFLVDEHEQAIHFRSASRVGRSDLGVNRRRMEAIVSEFESRHAGT